jgi:tol-pal system protein YbgF
MTRCAALAAAVLLAACGSTEPEPPQAAPPQPAIAAPDPRVAEMQILINELMDRIEVLTARLAALESGSVTTTAPAQTAVAPPRRPLGGGPTAAPSAARPAPQREAAATRPASVSVGDRYKEAIALFGKGRLDDSRAAFEQILAADPGGDLADNALFWIGETHFVQGKFPEAIDAYRRLLAEYGQENKAPDAMLKIGMAQARLGDLAMAKTTFEGLIERYPYSTAAATARHEVERIRY